MVDDSSDETNRTLNLSFTNAQVSRMDKAFQKNYQKLSGLR